MDIKLPYSLLGQYLDTEASVMQVVDLLTACGPTVDRVTPEGDDTILEIEVITNRVDSVSAFGIAREAAAILPTHNLKASLKNDPYQDRKYRFKPGNDLPLEVQILDQSLVRRFTAVVLEDVKVGPSSPEVVALLEKSGTRSVDNVVDISNELTLRFGQPVHIFDYDKLRGSKLVLRESRRGETVTTLDGRQHKLLGKDIVIADGEGRLIDLCGIMGGELSKVDGETKRIVLFVQTYEPRRVRRTSLYTQERTLAAQIFEKSPDAELVIPTLNRGIEMLMARTGAKVAGKLVDIYQPKPKRISLDLDLAWLNRVAGVTLEKAQVVGILKRLGFSTINRKQNLKVTVPSWRLSEVSIAEDLAEEILRLSGYFKLPSSLPCGFAPYEQEPLLRLESFVKHYLSDIGFSESYTYSLLSSKLLTDTNLSPAEAPALKNPLSEDYTHLRTSLAPNLISTLALNRPLASGTKLFFEVSNVYLNWTGKDLPQEVSHLCLSGLNLEYAQLKGYIEGLFRKLRIKEGSVAFKVTPHPFLTPAVEIWVDKASVGYLGLLSPSVASNFSLPPLPLVELNLDLLASLAFGPFDYQQISKFPPILEEVTVDSPKPISEILLNIRTVSELVTGVTYLGSLESKHSFSISFQSSDRNLTRKEIAPIKQKILSLA